MNLCRPVRTLLIVVALAVFSAGNAFASSVTIDFGLLGGANQASLGTYVEDGFTVTPTGGDWFEAHAYGNPVPSIFAGPIGSPSVSTIEITGGLFQFTSVDLSSNNGASTYDFIGYLGGILQFGQLNFSVLNAIAFNTYTNLFGSYSIDRLVITLHPDQNASSINLDNIVLEVEAVPEPASLLLLGTGLLGAVSIRRWRQRKA